MRFSLKYNGEKFFSDDLVKKSSTVCVENGTETTKTVFELDVLEIVQVVRKFRHGGEHSVLHIANIGDRNSGIISDVFDADMHVDTESEKEFLPLGYFGEGTAHTQIHWVVGSDCTINEFKEYTDRTYESGTRYVYRGGGNAEIMLPFFEAENGKGKGFIMAVGWSGQWFAYFRQEDGQMLVQTGIDKLHFYLKPNEKIRTASVLLMEYSGTRIDAHNRWRNVMREHFTYRKNGSASPLSLQTWGGSSSDFLIRQAKRAESEALGFEYFWVDAGWYGDYHGRSRNEHTGEWSLCTGDWFPNANAHPRGMEDMFAEVSGCGMKPLLWFEPERVMQGTRLYREHRDWLLSVDTDDAWLKQNYILNLGIPEARDWLTDLLCGFVEKFGLKCIRLDFNINPIAYWEQNDESDRRGLTQIGHIMGVYEVWDRLLARCPDVIIDNCSSGGKRIDIETCLRAIPLWRSDRQCAFDYNPVYSQNQSTGLSWWIVEHGCGIGKDLTDLYRFRSCYGTAMSCVAMGYEEFENDRIDFEKARRNIEEYKQVRKFFDKEYYPVFGFPVDQTSWSGWQYHCRECDEGIVMAFRREESLFASVTVPLGGLSAETMYELYDADENVKKTVSGRELTERGLEIRIPHKRESRLIRYRGLNEQ